MVAFSVPVRDSSGNVIGVFCRTAHLGELQVIQEQRLKSETDDSVRRVIALIDSRDWQVLDHPYLTKSNTIEDGFSREEFSRLHVDEGNNPGYSASGVKCGCSGNRDILLPNYKDPIGSLGDEAATPFKSTWMAAMSPVSVANMEAPWMVIVQEERSATLQPIQDMAKQATKQRGWPSSLHWA